MAKIVVVEDDVYMREELLNLLEKSGYDTIGLSDFENAVSEIAAYFPDLILLDINLPFRSGFEICKELKAMTAQISKSEQDERGLLPYPVIIAATKGDPEAMNIVVQHYESYIASLSMRKLRDERGNIYWGIDEDIRDRLRSRLMRAVLSFKV